jgi:hypothetical protein
LIPQTAAAAIVSPTSLWPPTIRGHGARRPGPPSMGDRAATQV